MKLMYLQCHSRDWIDVAGELERKHGWSPCYWVANADMRAPVQERFPAVHFHETMDAWRGIPAQGLEDLPQPALSQELLHGMAYTETVTLKMMDLYGEDWLFPYNERIRQYHRLLRYWMAVLDHVKPDMAVFPADPHAVFNYVLHQLCRHRGIETVVFQETKIPDFFLAVSDMNKPCPELSRAYARKLETAAEEWPSLGRKMEEYWARITGLPYDKPLHTKFMLRNMPPKPGLRHAFKVIKNRPPRNYQKYPGLPIEFPGKANRFVHLMKLHESFWRQKRLMRYYDKLARTSDIDLSTPFVYCALHCQPERATSPMAGEFTHQALIIDMLAKNLPRGWKIYVKEHPTNFYWAKRTERGRRKYFYDDIAAYDNVQLVPRSFNSFQLVDAAQATVTATGSVALESVLRGTPVLSFGFAWYHDCEGIFPVQDERTLAAVLHDLKSGYSVDKRKVRLFLQAIEEAAFKGFSDLRQAHSLQFPIEDRVPPRVAGIERIAFAREAPGADANHTRPPETRPHAEQR